MDPAALLESALNSLPDGLALLDCEGKIVFWNLAAQEITGYAGADVLACDLPEGLESLADEERQDEAQPAAPSAHGRLIQARHKLGHDVPVIARRQVLRDEMGEPIGASTLFHPAARLDALPHGEAGDDQDVKASQEEFEERLRTEFEDFERGGQTFGVLWIGVDQGPELRKTHGAGACLAMLSKVQRALAQGLRPAEELGRWGEDEFLIIAHERTMEMLAAHARTLAGLARTADFRWWGDRVSLTVSMGAAQACAGEPLARLLAGAREAMETSIREGGNRVTVAPRARGDEAAASGGQA